MAADRGRELCYEMLLKNAEQKTFSNLMLGSEDVTDFVRAAVYGTITYLIAIDHVIKHASGKDVSEMDPQTATIVRFGTWQLLFSDKVPAYAAISSSVDLAKKYCPRSSGFVNAVLRKVDALPKEQKDISSYKPNIACALKPEVFGIFKRDYGKDRALSIGKALLKVCDTTIRINPLKISKDSIMAELEREGFTVHEGHFIPEALSIIPQDGARIDKCKAYDEGDFFVQGEGAMLASIVADPKKGDKILDVCSAPGGKSTHMAQMVSDECEITSLDINESRLELIRENAARLGITSITAQRADSTNLKAALGTGKEYDIVLADVPCSGLGLMSGKPDIRHTISFERIKELLPKQAQILKNAAAFVKKGGTLIYSTCTLNREENEDQVASFLADNPDFYADDITRFLPDRLIIDEKRKEDAEAGMITLLPDTDLCEGFFIARLKRR